MDFSFISKLPRDRMILVCGATATGKSALALEIASRLDGVVINADSTQLYRELPLLTAQPGSQHYSSVPHVLYGVVSCREKLSVALWLRFIEKELKKCLQCGKVPIIVGGTGLYIRALLFGIAKIPEISEFTKSKIQYLVDKSSCSELHALLASCDPRAARKVSINDAQRIIRGLEVFEETKIPLSTWQDGGSEYHKIAKDISSFMIQVKPPREVIYKRCNERFLQMLKDGAIEEVESVLRNYSNSINLKVLGFYELSCHLNGTISIEEAVSKAQQKTRNYAKRQFTWFNNQFIYDVIIPNAI